MNSKSLTLGPAIRRPDTVRPGNARAHPFFRSLRQEEAASTDPLARDAKSARVEAILFLADEAITPRRLAETAGLTDAAEAREMIEKLEALYESDGSAFHIEELAGGWQLLTRAEFHPWLLRLRRTGHDLRLTPTVLETLAVIAYKQPLTRADVEAIRGVSCTETVRILMEKGLVRVTGRHQSLGRPQLYGTTKKFLQAFGLNTLNDLPEVESLKRPG